MQGGRAVGAKVLKRAAIEKPNSAGRVPWGLMHDIRNVPVVAHSAHSPVVVSCIASHGIEDDQAQCATRQDLIGLINPDPLQLKKIILIS